MRRGLSKCWKCDRAWCNDAGVVSTQGPERVESGLCRHIRSLERQWHEAGISSAPAAIIINDKYLISGGQPADAFERALRSIAAES